MFQHINTNISAILMS